MSLGWSKFMIKWRTSYAGLCGISSFATNCAVKPGLFPFSSLKLGKEIKLRSKEIKLRSKEITLRSNKKQAP